MRVHTPSRNPPSFIQEGTDALMHAQACSEAGRTEGTAMLNIPP